MKQKDQLHKLRQVTELLLDTRLAALRTAARAKMESESQLAGLTVPAPQPGALPEVSAELASLTYQRWADARRAEINLVLARQTVEWMEARDEARLAFGKKQALGGITTKLAEQARKSN